MTQVENIEYKRIGKSAINCMRLTALIWNVIIVALVVAVSLILNAKDIISPTIAAIIIAVVSVLAITYVIVAPIIRYKRYRYYIDDDMLVVVEGLFFITKSIAPIERLHQIAIKRGPLDRMFGMSNVVVTTAGGQVKIAFLDTDVAEEISSRLKTRINGIVKAEKADEALKEEATALEVL